MNKSLFLIPLVALTMACKPSEDEEILSSEPARRDIAFVGEVDPKFVGVWKSDTGDLRYNFSKEGTYTYKGTINTMGGPQKMDMSGEWKVQAGIMALKDSKGEVYDYDAVLSGSSLSLTTKGARKIKFKYTKE